MNKEDETENKTDNEPEVTQENEGSEAETEQGVETAVASDDTGGGVSLSFTTALEAVKKGKKIAREIWDEVGLTLSWVPGKGRGKAGYLKLNNPKTNPKLDNQWTPGEAEKQADDWYILED